MNLTDVVNAKTRGRTRPDPFVVSGSAVIVDNGHLKEALTLLKNEPELEFSFLIDLFGVDYMNHPNHDNRGGQNRFAVVYNLYSFSRNHRLLIKTFVNAQNPRLPSSCDLWPAANWYEREVWDLFGIHFENHPHLKRLLMYEEFQGHPLRKDYPVDRRQPLIGGRHENHV